MTEKTLLNYELRLDLDGEPTKIKMTYGLLTELASLVQNPENVALMGLNAHLSREISVVAITPRDQDGDPLLRTDKELNQLLDKLTVEDAEKLQAWVQEHLIDFFMKGVQTTQKVMDRLKPAIEDSTSSSAGSKA